MTNKSSIPQNTENNWKQKILMVLRSTGFQLGFTVSLLIVVLLITLNIIVVRQSSDAFVTVISEATRGPGYQRIADFLGRDPDLLQFYLDGTERAIPLQQEFLKIFQSSLIKIGIVTTLVSFVSASFAALLFTRPLKKLTYALADLRESNYYRILRKTGTPEIDEVIEEFNHLAAALKDIERLRSNAIADTSHELKTPLTSIKAQMEGIKDGVLKIDQNRATEILFQVDRLTELIDRMQDYAKLQRNALSINKKSVSVKELVEKSIKDFEKDLESHSLTVKVSIPDTLKKSIDTSLFGGLISNLISNTIRYADATEITIYADSKRLTFSDNGKGIASKDLKYIFERFYRVEKSRNRNTGGLGLGLAIVKEVVSAHGWDISVKSNKGLEFCIVF